MLFSIKIRNIPRCWGRVLSIMLFICAPFSWADDLPDYKSQYDEALKFARNGEFGKSLQIFSVILPRAPTDQYLRADYAEILSKAGRNTEAASEFRKLNVDTMPFYGLLAAGKAARNAKLYNEAISYYQKAILRQPSDVVAQQGLILALADAGKVNDALELAGALKKKFPRESKIYVAEGYAYERSGNYFAALGSYDRALRLNANDQDAATGRLLAISRMGANSIAQEEARRYPSLPDSVLKQLQEDAAAQLVKYSESVYSNSIQQDFRPTDQALAAVEENLKKYPGSLRSRFDLVRVLQNRLLPDRAIAIYEELLHEHIPDTPGYVHSAAGKAYMAKKNPEAAAQAFESAIKVNPQDFESSVGLFYAYSDVGEFAKAQGIVERLLNSKLDPKLKLEAEMYAAWGTAFRGQLEESQNAFQRLWGQAPYNPELTNAVGQLYQWRGWPRQAKQQYLLIARREPNNISAQIGLARSAMALSDYRGAEANIIKLAERSPDNPDVKEVLEDWQVKNMMELAVDVNVSTSKDSRTKGKGMSVNTELRSPPGALQTRFFAHHYFERGEFETQTGYDKRLGVGLEYIVPDLGKVLGVELQQDLTGRRGVQGIISLAAAINDYWSVQGAYDSNSIDVPLLGRITGISGKSTTLSARYRASELMQGSLTYQRLPMSDGNLRSNAAFRGEWIAITKPTYKASFILDLQRSMNSLENSAYFNPQRDTSASLTFKNDWLTYRRYAKSFHQNLYLSLGSYAQQGFPAGQPWAVTYEHAWDFNKTASLTYRAGYSKHFFDGAATYGSNFSLSGVWRF